jgi:hypothetical protein
VIGVKRDEFAHRLFPVAATAARGRNSLVAIDHLQMGSPRIRMPILVRFRRLPSEEIRFVESDELTHRPLYLLLGRPWPPTALQAHRARSPAIDQLQPKAFLLFPIGDLPRRCWPANNKQLGTLLSLPSPQRQNLSSLSAINKCSSASLLHTHHKGYRLFYTQIIHTYNYVCNCNKLAYCNYISQHKSAQTSTNGRVMK